MKKAVFELVAPQKVPRASHALKAEASPIHEQQGLPLSSALGEPQADYKVQAVGSLQDTAANYGSKEETPGKRHQDGESLLGAAGAETVPAITTTQNVGPEGRAFTETVGVGSLRYIGQIMNSYLLCENASGLVVIDQHAVHERILYEDLKKQYAASAMAGQRLLFPHMIEPDNAEKMVLDQYQDDIARMGVEIMEFGGGSYVVKAVPALLGHLDVEEILAGIFEQLLPEKGADSPSKRVEHIFADMACKSAIKANHAMLPEEATELLKNIQASPAFSHCPHGRPVMKQFSGDDMKKWFRRT